MAGEIIILSYIVFYYFELYTYIHKKMMKSILRIDFKGSKPNNFRFISLDIKRRFLIISNFLFCSINRIVFFYL